MKVNAQTSPGDGELGSVEVKTPSDVAVSNVSGSRSAAPIPKVVIVGCGFGGLNAAKKLGGQPVEVTVIDRDNYHGFWPLLYQVATSGLGPEDVASPIRAVLSGWRNVTFQMGTVCGFDLERHIVHVEGGSDVPYDYLILAAGSSTGTFGIPGVAEHAFALKTLPDAVRLRNHILTAFETAAATTGPLPPGALTTVLIGGGPTGVEMAGAVAELITHNLRHDFGTIAHEASVVLMELTDHLLPSYSARSRDAAAKTLRSKGVQLRFGTRLVGVSERGVMLEGGETIDASTVIWTAGIRANPLAEHIPGPKGRGGTIPVNADLSLPGHPEVFVIGDLAAVEDRHGEPLPQVAQVAIQAAKHTAANIARQRRGEPTQPFRYRDHGTMSTIGRRSAVAEFPGGLKLRGTIGWLAWLLVHLLFLVGLRNRAMVLANWVWNYLTWDRAVRVILSDGSHNGTDPELL